jgi:hypothetical protein
MVIPQPVADLGTVAQGEIVATKIQILNQGTEALQIKAVRPTCGCTVVDYDKEIPAGGSGYINAKLDTTSFSGPITKSVLVVTNDPDTPSVSIALKAQVQAYVEVLPRPLLRISTFQDQGVTEKLTVVSNVLESFKVTKVDVDSPYLKTEVRKLRDDELVPEKKKDQYEIAVTLDKKAPAGPLSAVLTIETDHDKAKRIKVKVFGIIRAAVSITPSQVQFGSVAAATKPGRYVVVADNRPEGALKVTGAEVNDPAFAVELSTVVEGKKYQVTVTVMPDAAVGTRDAVLTITTTDPD